MSGLIRYLRAPCSIARVAVATSGVPGCERDIYICVSRWPGGGENRDGSPDVATATRAMRHTAPSG